MPWDILSGDGVKTVLTGRSGTLGRLFGGSELRRFMGGMNGGPDVIPGVVIPIPVNGGSRNVVVGEKSPRLEVRPRWTLAPREYCCGKVY